MSTGGGAYSRLSAGADAVDCAGLAELLGDFCPDGGGAGDDGVALPLGAAIAAVTGLVSATTTAPANAANRSWERDGRIVRTPA
jgi:hypothetical protein